MKSKFLFLISSIFLVFLVSSVSAVVIYGDWQDQSQSIQINFGESVSFNADFFTMSPPMNIDIKLYDSSNHLVHSFENNHVVNTNGFAQTYTITSAIYQTSGTFHLVLSGNDSFPSSFSHTLTLIVTPLSINHPPVITSNPVTQVDESKTYNYQVVSTDADGDTLTYSLVQAPSWLSINSATGLVSGTAPSVNSDTHFNVTVRVSDGKENADQSYVLTVRNIPSTNNPPVANSQSVITNKNTPVNVILTATDADGNVLTFSIAGSPLYGVLSGFNPSTGQVTYTPNTDFVGIDSFTFRANDGIADSNTATVSITITPISINHPPVITSNPVTQVDESKTYNYQVTATDADGDTLTYSLVQAPSWLSINSATGLVSGTAPSVNSDTDFSVTVSVSDGKSGSVIQSYTLKVKDVSEDNGNGDGRKGGSHGTRIIPDQEFETQKYLDQFVPKTIALEEEKSKVEKKNLFWILVILFGLLCLILLIILIALLIRRSRQKA